MKQKLSELRATVEAALLNAQYKESTIRQIICSWNMLQRYMTENDIEYYSVDVGEAFKQLTLSCNKASTRAHVRHIQYLDDGLTPDNIVFGLRKRHKSFSFEGSFKAYFDKFAKVESINKSPVTIQEYALRLRYLYQYLTCKNIEISDFDIPECMKFLSYLEAITSISHRSSIVMTFRVFIRHLCHNKVLKNNNTVQWQHILKIRYFPQSTPSTYTEDEINKVVKIIDRASPKGKRDYAMILISARYGLRATDIAGLRLCNFDWNKNTLSVIQSKTGRKVSHPLSEEVGEAIIDYIKFGRKSIDSPYLFLGLNAPYPPIGVQTLYSSISNWLRTANIEIGSRKKGSHSFRHSLATNLLKRQETLPTISSILGHKNSNSTTIYLRVELDLLRVCSLEVPFTPSIIYLR